MSSGSGDFTLYPSVLYSPTSPPSQPQQQKVAPKPVAPVVAQFPSTPTDYMMEGGIPVKAWSTNYALPSSKLPDNATKIIMQSLTGVVQPKLAASDIPSSLAGTATGAFLGAQPKGVLEGFLSSPIGKISSPLLGGIEKTSQYQKETQAKSGWEVIAGLLGSVESVINPKVPDVSQVCGHVWY